MEKQEVILDMIPEIKKHFRCSSWPFFTYKAKKPYLSLIRSIYTSNKFLFIKNNINEKVDKDIVKKLYITIIKET